MKLNKRFVFSFYKYYLGCYVLLMIITAVSIYLFPMNIFIKMMLTGVIIGFIGGLILLVMRQVKHKPVILLFVVGIIVFVTGYFLTYNPSMFKRDKHIIEKYYYKHAKDYIGTKYKEGGESKYGIDAAGVARCALWQSVFEYSIYNRDWELLFTYFPTFWWRDLNSQDILLGKYGYTYQKGYFKNIYEISYETQKEIIHPGDMVYLSKNELLMIYIGNNQYIRTLKGDTVRIFSAEKIHTEFQNDPVVIIGWSILKNI